MKELNSLSDREEDLFRSSVATKIYNCLKEDSLKFNEIESKTGCSTDSISRNLEKGKDVGIWVKLNDVHLLTSKGENLPDAVSKLEKLREEDELEVNGKKYAHSDVEAGHSYITQRLGENGRFTEHISTLASSNKIESDGDEQKQDTHNQNLSNHSCSFFG